MNQFDEEFGYHVWQESPRMDCSNVTTKSAQHAHARMIAIIVEKSPNSSHMYDHGFMDNTNRQAVKIWQNHFDYKMAASMT